MWKRFPCVLFVRTMQAKGTYRKKQQSVKSLFGRPQPLKRADAMDNGYRYTPSSPIDIPYPTYKDPCFPAIQENVFEILDSKEINSLLTVAFCGVRRGNSHRLWSFCQGTPTCRIERLYAKVDMGTTNDRFMLIPDFFSDALGSEFTAFLDHIEGVSEKCKQLFLEGGYDTTTWKSPVRSNNGVVQGLQVKARQKIMSDRLYALVGKSVQAVIKLSCAYFTPERCGLSFEIIDVLCKEGEPKEEWVTTTPTKNDQDEELPFSMDSINP